MTLDKKYDSEQSLGLILMEPRLVELLRELGPALQLMTPEALAAALVRLWRSAEGFAFELIGTTEELENLPVGSVLMEGKDFLGDEVPSSPGVWQRVKPEHTSSRCRHCWVTLEDGDTYTPDVVDLPAYLLWSPKDTIRVPDPDE